MKRFSALVAAAAVTVLASPAAHAGKQQGVKCPSGYDAVISDGNKKLVCRTTRRYEKGSICYPVQVSPQVSIKPLSIVMETTGSDQCLNVLTGSKTPSLMLPPAPGLPAASEFAREVSAAGPDRFVATRTEYAFPTGTTYPVGNPANGVSCPAGYDGDQVSGGSGIRCDKLDGSPKPADCDGVGAGPVVIGWKWTQDHVGSEDRCLPMSTGPHGPTKPQGMTKVQHDLERASDSIGWILDKKSGARDTWRRKVYEWPNHNN